MAHDLSKYKVCTCNSLPLVHQLNEHGIIVVNQLRCLVLHAQTFHGHVVGRVDQHVPPNPEHPNKCWIPEAEAAVEPGKTFSKIGSCMAYVCHDDFSYEGVQCGLTGAPPPCKTTEVDNTKLYPDCCPKVECP